MRTIILTMLCLLPSTLLAQWDPLPSSQDIPSQVLTYAQGYHRYQDNGDTLVVLCGATWCPSCMTTKVELAPLAKRRGVAYVYLDVDSSPEDYRRLRGSQTIPEVVVYRRGFSMGRNNRVVRVKGKNVITLESVELMIR